MTASVPERTTGPVSVPLLRWSLANSTGLAALYLLLSAAVEVARRVAHARWAERLSLGLESLPARTLEVLGLMDPLRRHWMAGDLSDVQVRLLYGLTSVTLIYFLGLVVGSLMWAGVRLWTRRRVDGP
jgi:hypothetical protein